MLDFDLFRRVVDEAGPSLVRIDFFNYGETFLHKRAVEMCEYIKTHFPQVYLYTSTNGLAFSEEQVTAAGALGDRRGDVFDRRRDAGELRRSTASAGDFDEGDPQPARWQPTRSGRSAATCPFLNWRYILFTHNDSDEEMNAGTRPGRGDRRRPALLGAHRPPGEPVLAPLRAGHSRISPRSSTRSGTTTTWATRFPVRRPAREIEVRGPLAPLPVLVRPGQRVTLKARVRNLSTRPFPAQASYGRRLVRLGAQLCARDGSVINRDFERAWLPGTLAPGASAEVPITVTAPEKAGPLRAEVRSGQRGD